MNAVLVTFALKLMFVKEIRETDAGPEIQFVGGCVGRLPRQGNGKYAENLGNAREGLKNKFPVVTTMARPDRVVTIDSADSDTARDLKDYDADRLQVVFWGHAARYYLRKDNPDFHRVRAALEQSAKNRSLVWLSFELRDKVVVDALPVERGARK
jgi:hypothetical protein